MPQLRNRRGDATAPAGAVLNSRHCRRTVSASLVLALPAGLKALPEMAWGAMADGRSFVFNDRWLAVTGMPEGVHHHDNWLAAAHPDDRAGLGAGWAASVAALAPFEAMFRLRRVDGSFGWVLARATAARGDGRVALRWIGTAVDIDAVKAGGDAAALLAGELAHRISNIFTIIGSVLSLSAREYPEAAAFADSTRARIEALAQAHSFIWPLSDGGDAAPQHAQQLIGLLVQPYAEPEGPLVTLSGDDAVIGDAAATWITLIVHELATNSVKYGALSCPTGRVAIRLRHSPTQLTVIWSETGGPTIAHAPVASGFGSALIDRVARLGQATPARRWWRPEGLALVIRFDLAPHNRLSGGTS